MVNSVEHALPLLQRRLVEMQEIVEGQRKVILEQQETIENLKRFIAAGEQIIANLRAKLGDDDADPLTGGL